MRNARWPVVFYCATMQIKSQLKLEILHGLQQRFGLINKWYLHRCCLGKKVLIFSNCVKKWLHHGKKGAIQPLHRLKGAPHCERVTWLTLSHQLHIKMLLQWIDGLDSIVLLRQADFFKSLKNCLHHSLVILQSINTFQWEIDPSFPFCHDKWQEKV